MHRQSQSAGGGVALATGRNVKGADLTIDTFLLVYCLTICVHIFIFNQSAIHFNVIVLVVLALGAGRYLSRKEAVKPGQTQRPRSHDWVSI